MKSPNNGILSAESTTTFERRYDLDWLRIIAT
ncbi:hypothetical protein LCGC14_2062880 [marine sediment metagenome]|uniref:Uncharacterized protein n=1 Tax=marine sediment metagenome TaxID=412755 RepID=A0A0F9F811_9ZZZZ